MTLNQESNLNNDNTHSLVINEAEPSNVPSWNWRETPVSGRSSNLKAKLCISLLSFLLSSLSPSHSLTLFQETSMFFLSIEPLFGRASNYIASFWKN